MQFLLPLSKFNVWISCKYTYAFRLVAKSRFCVFKVSAAVLHEPSLHADHGTHREFIYLFDGQK